MIAYAGIRAIQKARPCERTGLRSCYHLTSRSAHALRLIEYPSILRQISVPTGRTYSPFSPAAPGCMFPKSFSRLSPTGNSLSAFRQRYFFPSTRSLMFWFPIITAPFLFVNTIFSTFQSHSKALKKRSKPGLHGQSAICQCIALVYADSRAKEDDCYRNHMGRQLILTPGNPLYAVCGRYAECRRGYSPE